jgi:hypothetical protein
VEDRDCLSYGEILDLINNLTQAFLDMKADEKWKEMEMLTKMINRQLVRHEETS